MRKVIYGGANSLDNYLAGPGEEIDWLRWSDDSAKIVAETFKGVDAMLMGRKTFEFSQKMGGGPAHHGVKTYVFSRTMGSLPAGAQLVSEDAAAFVRRLKGEPGGNILVMGGGELGSALIEAGLVDEIGFNIHPILLGDGTPAFHRFTRRIDLELIEARQTARECVLVRYRVVNRPEPSAAA